MHYNDDRVYFSFLLSYLSEITWTLGNALEISSNNLKKLMKGKMALSGNLKQCYCKKRVLGNQAHFFSIANISP